MDDEPDRSRFRRLPPRVRPTGSEHDVSAPPAAAEAQYVSWLSPAGTVRGYEQLADYLTTTEPRRSWRRIVALAILGGGLLLSVLMSLLTWVF